MKQIILAGVDDISKYRETIYRTAEKTKRELSNTLVDRDGITALEIIKFDKVGCDPLDPERELNFIEQVNQTFTYLASLKAAEYLFSSEADITSLRLNLGTQKGSDIESLDGLYAAEVFAATHPGSNNKLAKDITKVKKSKALYKYVFFSCPDIPEGPYNYREEEEVIIWSLRR